MSTWGQLRLLLQQSAAEISPDLIDGYLNTRYGDVLDRYPWKGLEVKAVLETTAAYQTGTVSVTQGSTAVEGTGTVLTAGMTGMKFRVSSDTAIYAFTWVDATHGTLDRNYEGSTNLTAGFSIFQDEYVLPATTKTVLSVVSPVMGVPLEDWTERQLLGEGFGYLGQPNCPGTVTAYAVTCDTNEAAPPVNHQIQFFPPPKLAQGYPLRYQKATAGFSGANTSSAPLPFVSDNVLLCGGRADIKRKQKDYAGAELEEALYEKAILTMLKADGVRRGNATPVLAPQWSGYRLKRVMR
jgi:hypothetical protein